jgi:phosphoribosylformylglycinamidine synthase
MATRATIPSSETQSSATQSYLARIDVMLKPLVNDPQGLAVRDGLHTLGFEAVTTVRVGKRMEITLEAVDSDAAEQAVREMCDRLLSNPVIEDFSFEVVEA